MDTFPELKEFKTLAFSRNPQEIETTATTWFTDVWEQIPATRLTLDKILTKPFTDTDTLIGTCTDERIINRQTLQNEDQNATPIRFVGGASGLFHSIEESQDYQNLAFRQNIITIANKNSLHLYNHRDNLHGNTSNQVGCGYLGLLTFEEAAVVFNFTLSTLHQTVHQYVSEMQTALKVPVVELKDEHTAGKGGLFINLHSNQALKPEGEAKNSFFSLDLGPLSTKLKQMAPELGLNNEIQYQVLKNITRDNIAACYILSNGAIAGHRITVIPDNANERQEELKNIIFDAYQECTEKTRIAAMNVILQKRQTTHH